MYIIKAHYEQIFNIKKFEHQNALFVHVIMFLSMVYY